jgi:hypothetical protein
MTKSCDWRCKLVMTLAAVIGFVSNVHALTLEQIWTHNAGGTGRAEIVAFDSAAEEFLVVNGTERCVMRLDARTGRELGRLDVAKFGDPTSVAAARGLVAVAVVAPQKTDPGNVVLFLSNPHKLEDAQFQQPAGVTRVGSLPDMVTFSPHGRYILTANEGEPSDDYRIDPEGSISVIDIGLGARETVALTADFVAYNARREELEKQGVRLVAPNPDATDCRATVAQDLEPEFIAGAPNGHTVWVTLQENNALAEVDLETALVTRVVGLGLKDHSRGENGLDAGDQNGGARIRREPVFGMYQPDGIAAYEVDGTAYLVTANEGDAREYGNYAEAARVSELTLDQLLLAADAELQSDARLGRLNVARTGGDTDGDGDVDRLLAFGGRSMAIWTTGGELVYDSGDALERFIAKRLPERFNIDGAGGNVDARSPEKGPEPEGLVIGRVGEATYAFVGLERTSAVAVFDITRPASARLVDVVPLSFEPNVAGGPHVAPEGLAFVPAEQSPLGEPLLAVACEVSGTTILFRVRPSR